MKGYITAILITAAISIGSFPFYKHLFESPRYIEDTLYSGVLDEDREIIVRLPRHYENEQKKKYPVIIKLDGSNRLWRWDDSLDILTSVERGFEAIVVALPNTSGPNRQRDYTPPNMKRDLDIDKPELGEADKFLQFIKTEVIPYIDDRYRTDSKRMIAGHSRGGLFVVYSMITDPSYFSAYFAFSPAIWRDESLIVNDFNNSMDKLQDCNCFLYMSMGDNENKKMKAAYSELTELLQLHQFNSLKWQADYAKNADHKSTPIIAIPIGLSKLTEERKDLNLQQLMTLNKSH